MDIKSLERRVEENSFSIENIVSVQKNSLVWELDIVDKTKNTFTFYCGNGSAALSLILLANTNAVGEIVVDEKVIAVNKNFVAIDVALKRGSHVIKVNIITAILGGKLEVKTYGARK